MYASVFAELSQLLSEKQFRAAAFRRGMREKVGDLGDLPPRPNETPPSIASPGHDLSPSGQLR